MTPDPDPDVRSGPEGDPGAPSEASSPAGPPRARDDVVFRRVAGDWLLFDPRAGRIHVLNLTAALVWSFCTGDHAPDEIVEEVAGAFGEDPDGVPGDASGAVSDALERFRREGLLR